jgi:hypothetical protein
MTKATAKQKPLPEPVTPAAIDIWRGQNRPNPLKEWLNDTYPPRMLQKEFAERAGISQSFLTSLLSDQPPWPARATLRKIIEITEGAVTADMWVEMPDPPPRVDRGETW